MTAKKYLNQAWEIKLRIESMTEMLAFLKSVIGYATPQLSATPRPATPNIRKHEDDIVRILDIEERIQSERDKMDEVLNVISNISDPTAQAVIVKRYIERKPWYKIASETYISRSHVFTLHNDVLDEIDSLLEKTD